MSGFVKRLFRFIFLSLLAVTAFVASSTFAKVQKSINNSSHGESSATVSQLSSLSTTAQSRSLYMPLLQSNGSADSKLALANPTLEPATVTLTARSFDGTVLK